MRRQNRDAQGKLRKLARRWAGGRSSSSEKSELELDCERFGIDPAALPSSDTVETGNVVLWPDMVDSVALFFAMSTQWVWSSAGMAGTFRVGLNYSALEPAARLSGLTVTPVVFDDIRILEQEALSVWNRKR